MYEKIHFANAVHDKLDSQSHSPDHDIRQVDFSCYAPGAKAVHLVGDFNHQYPILMEPRGGDYWFIQVWLFPGRYHYHFLVDGQPMLDSRASGSARDEHDEPVSVADVS